MVSRGQLPKPVKIGKLTRWDLGKLDAVAVSRATLYAEMKKGTLEFIKLGAATRIEISELDRWINEKSEAVNEAVRDESGVG